MNLSSLLSATKGGGRYWQSICLDLNISVKAESRDAAIALLETAVTEHVQRALTQGLMLNEPAPWSTVLRWTWPCVVFARISGHLRSKVAHASNGRP